MPLTRRQFLGSSAAAVIAAGTVAKGKVFGANDKIRVACIGLHGQGGSHVNGFMSDESEVVALCDVDEKVLDKRVLQVKQKTDKRPKTFKDMRDLFADDSIDAVSFATPNHWHTLGAIWACQAGKDVYVEKPLSHDVWEGRQLAAAAAQYDRIVQHGTQRRSDPRWVRAIQRMRAGVIGDIYMARGLCYKNRDSIGFKEPTQPPASLDWELWQGPAPEQPFTENYVHYNWHWFWLYGNGDIGNQGVHQMDVGIWGMNKGLPVKVQAVGGRYTYEDQGETPNTMVATYTYADGTLFVFEVRGRATNDEGGVKIGNLFYGSEGYMAEGTFYDKKGQEIPDSGEGGDPITVDGDHYATFLRAVRSRKHEDMAATALEGHISSAHCHLGNIAYRVGEQLEFDPENERFKGSREANKYLTRKYRPGFEVPELA